jgi:DNA-binding GntR family transcriptional regulator
MPLILPTPAGGGHRTKQEFVYHTLREAIMHGVLKPGERLIIDDLARQLEVSAIPVREALQLLQSESLVVTVPHAGASVAPISRDTLLDVFTVLEGLELVAMPLAAERATPADLAALDRILDDMDAALAADRHEDWSALNAQFHLRICSLTGLDLLQDMTRRMLDRWQRVRRFYFKDVLGRRQPQAQREHRQILAALRARDVPALHALTRAHMQGALTSYMAYLNEHDTGAQPTGGSRS